MKSQSLGQVPQRAVAVTARALTFEGRVSDRPHSTHSRLLCSPQFFISCHRSTAGRRVGENHAATPLGQERYGPCSPAVCAGLDFGSLLRVGWAFVAFSMTASAFYLINDVRDIEEYRKHPVKQHRPIAAGLIAIPLVLGIAAVLRTAGLVGSYVVAPWLAVTIGAYAFIQARYNLGLKEQPIIDIMVIAGGFVLRALGGAAAAGVPASG